MAKRADISLLLLLTALASVSVAAACAPLEAAPTVAVAEQAVGASVPIAMYDPAIHEDTVRSSRWRIVIHSGHGIPGTPGANEYYRKPVQVLQVIVDQCRLGPTVYQQATDGVSVLSILAQSLSEDQIGCIRSAEDSGLYLQDSGASQ